jgi:hypothetical protein
MTQKKSHESKDYKPKVGDIIRLTYPNSYSNEHCLILKTRMKHYYYVLQLESGLTGMRLKTFVETWGVKVA